MYPRWELRPFAAVASPRVEAKAGGLLLGGRRCRGIPLSGCGAMFWVRGSWDAGSSSDLGTQLPSGAPQRWAGFKLGSPVPYWGTALWGQTTSGASSVGV